MTGLIQDPGNADTFIISSAAEPADGFQVGATTLVHVHSATACRGRYCVVHNPSNHHMCSWKLNWRGDSRTMERICPHGIGHPDPDDVEYQRKHNREYVAVHGCDGCCTQRKGN